MIKRILRIIVLFFITTYSMGSVMFYEPLSGRKPPGSRRNVDTDLEVYVKRFEDLWGQKISFPVLFNHLPEMTAGRCTYWFLGDKVIEVDILYFYKLSDLGKEQLVFHELGHCALKRYSHDDSRVVFNKEKHSCSKTVMKSSIFDHQEMYCYQKYRQYYIDELFGRIK